MKKLSKILESIWSDMQDRGTRDIMKVEDDINHLDAESLYDYVNGKYKVKFDNIGHAIDEDGTRYTYIPVLVYGNGQNEYVYYLFRNFYPNDDITLNMEVKYLDRDLYDKLKERFSVLKYNIDFLKICPKNGRRIDNNFYIEVVEYIIDVANEDARNVYRKDVNESIWSDMQERGTGDIVKIEDEIDHKDIEEFYEYLGDKYYFPRDYYFKFYEEVRMIDIPLCQQDAKIHNLMYKPEKHQLFVLKYFISYLKSKNIYEQFNDKYRLEEWHMSYDINVFIEPKDGGEVTNSFCVEVLEFIIDLMNGNVKQDMIMVLRKENESIWSDMQERGTGDMIKIEDDVDRLDRNGLYDYLKSHYTLINPQYKIVNSPSGDSIEVPVFHKITNTEYIRRWFTKDEVLIPYVFPYMVNGLFRLLIHRYKLKQDITGRYYIISPADSSSVTNKFFLEVLDFITEFVPRDARCVEKMVKESVWSDMQDRGSGDIVKKEDDVNLMNGQKFYEHLKKTYDISQSKGGYHKFSNGDELIDISLFEYQAPHAIYEDHAGLLYYPSDNSVTIGCTSQKYKKIFSELISNFFANKDGVYFEKEYFHNVDNKMIIELLDLIIENIKQQLIQLIKK